MEQLWPHIPYRLRPLARRLVRIWTRWRYRGWERTETLRRTRPLSSRFGLDRGRPIDRFYVERFLAAHAADIQGRVLEMGDATYTQRFGGEAVTHSDVMHVAEGNPKATIVADLTRADHVPSDTFDCIIFTQTLQMIYDYRAALGHLYRILRPGGVLLLTTHGISKIGRRLGRDPWGEYWRFTAQSLAPLLEELFPPANVQVEPHGNVLAAVAFLHGLAVEELSREEIEYQDPDFEVLLTARARKPIR